MAYRSCSDCLNVGTRQRCRSAWLRRASCPLAPWSPCHHSCSTTDRGQLLATDPAGSHDCSPVDSDPTIAALPVRLGYGRYYPSRRRDSSRPVATGRDRPGMSSSLTIERRRIGTPAWDTPAPSVLFSATASTAIWTAGRSRPLTGDVYRVAPYSVSQHIAQTNEVIATTGSATGRDLLIATRRDRCRRRKSCSDLAAEVVAKVADNTPRQDATGRDMAHLHIAAIDREVGHFKDNLNHRYIEQLRKRIDEKDGQIGFLQDELKSRRDQFRGMKDIIPVTEAFCCKVLNSNMAPILKPWLVRSGKVL